MDICTCAGPGPDQALGDVLDGQLVHEEAALASHRCGDAAVRLQHSHDFCSIAS